MDNVLRTLSANETVDGSGIRFVGMDFSVSGRGSRGTSKSLFISLKPPKLNLVGVSDKFYGQGVRMW